MAFPHANTVSLFESLYHIEVQHEAKNYKAAARCKWNGLESQDWETKAQQERKNTYRKISRPFLFTKDT